MSTRLGTSMVMGWVLLLSQSSAFGELAATRQSAGSVVVSGDHFRLTVDPARGGEITRIALFDGSRWNRVLGADGQTCPAVTLTDSDSEFRLAHDAQAKLSKIDATPDLVRFTVTGAPKTADGKIGPWTVNLAYEVHREGAVFIDLDYTLTARQVTLTAASLLFVVDEAITEYAHFRTENPMSRNSGFDSGRVAFGVNPAKSYTNEIEAIVEYQDPMAAEIDYEMVSYGKTVPYDKAEYGVPRSCRDQFDKPRGSFAWRFVTKPTTLKKPYQYHNRFALGLGAAAIGRPKTNVVGQRIYTWINFLDMDNWYPTDEQIDKMAGNGGAMLILHKPWMSLPGANGKPHADYAPRDEKEMIRAVAHAHRRGIRVGYYVRGIEPYGFDFFKKYGRRDWDGLFVDWHGSRSIAVHDMRYDPEAGLDEKHFSKYGTHVPARHYFLLAKRMRELVGANGFLIGHQGCFNSGALANLNFDAYLPGETGTDWDMFSLDVDNAAYKGMLGSGVCTPWPIASPYRTPESVAKMAVWGFYPQVLLGYETKSYKPDVQVLAADPAAEINRWILPYWRLLSAIDMEKAAVFNLPSVNVVAAESSDPSVECLVYREEPDTFLVLVANVGEEAAQAEIALAPEVLGLEGTYEVSHIDAATGRLAPRGTCTTKLTTSNLPQWAIEAFKLTKPR